MHILYTYSIWPPQSSVVAPLLFIYCWSIFKLFWSIISPVCWLGTVFCTLALHGSASCAVEMEKPLPQDILMAIVNDLLVFLLPLLS